MSERLPVAAADWSDLAREIDLWTAAGRTPTLWWRDDDAVAATPALADLRKVARVPLALAVIPAAPDRPLQQSLADFLGTWPAAVVLQHGVTHQSHALPGAKNSEFPASRDLAARLSGLESGMSRLQNMLGAQFIPVLTPPWNRIADDLLPHLAGLGYRGISRFGEPPWRPGAPLAPLIEVNTEVDVIDWRGSRGFVGEGAALGRLVGHLAARRLKVAEPDLPTGILTHHLVHDTATWRFLENLQDWLAKRGAAHLFVLPSLLWPEDGPSPGRG
ncbi:MAG: polysaccharide deacetylase family protein [Rhodospirillaceae bacterium]|nr:polysaccharide deacetylase family protein [Rhodospirillaceae bacterium]